MATPTVKKADFWTALILMSLSGAVIYEALELELGTPANPGSGFMFFGTAVVLGILAFLQFLKALFLSGEPQEARGKIDAWRVVAVIGANVLYILALETVGFLLCTFLLLCFLFQVYERGKWLYAVGGAALTAGLTYWLFSYVLKLSLPKGLLALL